MSKLLKLDEIMLDRTIRATLEGLEMAGVVPNAVGASRVGTMPREVSVIVSLIGSSNGSLMLKVSKKCAAFLASRLLDEESYEFTDDTLDGICEIGNIIAGSAKRLLLDTEYAFQSISCPALVMGHNYDVHHYQGMTVVAVEFELTELPRIHMNERTFSVSIALMKS